MPVDMGIPAVIIGILAMFVSVLVLRKVTTMIKGIEGEPVKKIEKPVIVMKKDAPEKKIKVSLFKKPSPEPTTQKEEEPKLKTFGETELKV